MGLRVVVIDDDPGTCSFLEAAFSAEGHECRAFSRGEDAERYLTENTADLAIVDVYLGKENGIDLLRTLCKLCPALHPVIMTAHVSVETAARSMNEGAVDYISKPLTMELIRDIGARAVAAKAPEKQRVDQALSEIHGSAIIGRSPKMLEVYKAIGRVANSNANVLITGASG
jgi:DNA-binding NtrC family response regulator